jgi:hypothetical protein
LRSTTWKGSTNHYTENCAKIRVDSVFTEEWELRLHMCTLLSFSLLNTRLQELILSPVLSCLYNCVCFKDTNHFVGKSLKLEAILIVYVVYKLTLSCYIL